MSSAIRAASVFLSLAFAIISMSVGINALVKSKNLKSFVKANSPSGVTVNIDTNDVSDAGVVVTVGSGLLAVASLLVLLLGALRARFNSAMARRLAGAVHVFLSVWIFAALVPFDDFARNRQAKISAFLGNTQLPNSIVQQQEKTLGMTPVYWNLHYIRLVAIIPWFAILFGALAGAALLHSSASSERRAALGSGAGAGAALVMEAERDEKNARKDAAEDDVDVCEGDEKV